MFNENSDSIFRSDSVYDPIVDSEELLETDETEEASLPTHADDGRLIVRAKPSERRKIHSLVLGALRNTGKFFEQGGTIVCLHEGSSGELSIRHLNSADLMLAVDEVVVWQRLDGRRNEYVLTDAPEQFCNALLKASAVGDLQPLAGIAYQAFLREDGSICTAPGYDAASALYGSFKASNSAIPAAPSTSDAEAALAVLSSALEEFPFAMPSDRSAALAAMLTAAARQSLPTAPMFHMRAHQPGTGKSYLSALISALASPHVGAPQSFPSNNDECDKVLLATLKQGAAVIEFDNLTGDIVPFKKLCTVLTSERVSGRVLGSSRTVEVSTRSLILSSGNNVAPVGDMTRRCITVNLDARTEAPAARRFKNPDLLRHVRQRRTEYVAAALTIIRAWLVAGSPRAPCPALNSFERWSDWCRQPLLWLGQDDPAKSVYQAHDDDPDRQLLHQLLTFWNEAAGRKPMMVRELVNWADPLGPMGEKAADIREVLEDITSSHGRPINRKALGWWLKHRTGHIVKGLRLEAVPRSLNAQSWRVVRV